MQVTTFSQTEFHQASRYLLTMRGVILLAELLVLMVIWHLALLPATGRAALLVTLVHGTLALGAWVWLRYHPPRHALAISASLFGDLLLIGIWLYFTGGYTNPLTSLLLLPLAMAVILVPMRQSLMLAAAAVLIYRVLMNQYAAVRVRHHDGAYLEQLHLQGMWIAFILSALVLLVSVGALVVRLRRLQGALARAREERLHDEQIIALGLSAATAAHRIGTPLNTMSLLINEMRLDAGDPASSADLRLLDQQLAICTDHLRQLSESAARIQDSGRESIPLGQWLSRLRESATLLWPGSNILWRDGAPAMRVAVDATVDQAVLNLIANALKASPDRVIVGTYREGDRAAVSIQDRGEGLTASAAQKPGGEVVDSESGLGIGLFLSNASVQRLGGELRAAVDAGGTTMTILLPEHEDGD